VQCYFWDRTLARILHEAFYCERRKHGIFGLILEVRTRMYFSTIRPQTSRINFALRARTFRTSTALATKFRAICGLDSQPGAGRRKTDSRGEEGAVCVGVRASLAFWDGGAGPLTFDLL
jgi:hypothetical protein